MALSLAYVLTCTNPTTVSDAQEDIEKNGPSIAVNESGCAAVIWEADRDEEGFETMFQVSVKTDQHTWSPAQTLCPWSETLTSSAKIGIDSLGKISVCWETGTDRFQTNPLAHYTQRDLNGLWSLVSPIHFNQREFEILCASLLPSGEMVLGLRSKNGNAVLATNAFTPNEAEIKVEPFLLSESASSLNIFMNGKRKAMAIWHDIQDNSEKCSWYEEGVWSSAQKICSILQGETINDLYVNHENQAVVSWHVGDNNTRRAQVVTQSGLGWSPVKELSKINERSESPISATNYQGDILVVWDQGEHSKIGAVFKPKDLDWIDIPPIFVEEGSNFSPDIKSTDTGDFVVTWLNDTDQEDNDCAKTTIYGAIFPPQDQTWSNPAMLSPAEKSCFDSYFVMTGKGRGLITWVASELPNETNDCIQVAELKFEVQ